MFSYEKCCFLSPLTLYKVITNVAKEIFLVMLLCYTLFLQTRCLAPSCAAMLSVAVAVAHFRDVNNCGMSNFLLT